MATTLKPRPADADELVRDLPGSVEEVVADPRQEPPAPATSTAEDQRLDSPSAVRDKLVEEAHQIAKELYGCWTLAERIQVYKEVGQLYKSEWRRVLNIAAARWPELIPMVNDEVEWRALLSADLS